MIKFKGNGSLDKTNAHGNKKQWLGSEHIFKIVDVGMREGEEQG